MPLSLVAMLGTGLCSAMNAIDTKHPASIDDHAWLKILAKYRTPHRGRSAFELAATIIPFVVLWVLSWLAVRHGLWWGLALTIPASGFLLRLFMIQHDCGHGSFFAHRHADDWIGRVIGLLTLTPYDCWRRTHAEHHATAGNLGKRGDGEITTLTVAEYEALPGWRRLAYRLYRHPVVLFGIGPIWVFLLKQRLPCGQMRDGAAPWISAMATNLAIAAVVSLLVWLIGLWPFLIVHLSIVFLAGAAGIWLFYVQHQFEETHWAQSEDWEFQESALHGSSHYDLPQPLKWLTGNIGIHHVHHLSSRVPFYRLPEVLRDHPALGELGRITLLDSLGCVKLALWCETRRKLVSFREAHTGGAALASA